MDKESERVSFVPLCKAAHFLCPKIWSPHRAAVILHSKTFSITHFVKPLNLKK